MTIQFKNGKVLFVAGKIAMDPNCCCGAGGAETCCENGVPTAVTLSGATGCMAVMNGTFALTSILSCLSTSSVSFPPPSDCKVGACFSDTNYYHPLSVAITVSQSSVNKSGGITVQINLEKYNSSCLPGVDEIAFAQYDNDDCLAGSFDLTELTPPFNGTYATTCLLHF